MGEVFIVRSATCQLKDLDLENVHEICPCTLCKGTIRDDNAPLFDFRVPEAEWLQTLYDDVSWMASHPEACVLMREDYFTIYGLGSDFLHVKYLGTDRYFGGSVLWLLCFILLPGSAEENLDVVWAGITEHYRQHNTPNRFGTLQLSMFCSPTEPTESFPMLKGKGAEIRHVMPALLTVWRQHRNLANDMHTRVETGLLMSQRMDEIIDCTKGSFVLASPWLEEFRTAAFVFLQTQNSLAQYYNAHGLYLFNVTIKSHYMAHAAIQAAWMHPTLSWTFRGEDLMQHMKRMHSFCSQGRPSWQWGEAMLEKYVRAFAFELSPVSAWFRT